MDNRIHCTISIGILDTLFFYGISVLWATVCEIPPATGTEFTKKNVEITILSISTILSLKIWSKNNYTYRILFLQQNLSIKSLRNLFKFSIIDFYLN